MTNQVPEHRNKGPLGANRQNLQVFQEQHPDQETQVGGRLIVPTLEASLHASGSAA